MINKETDIGKAMREASEKAGPVKRTDVIFLADVKDPSFAEEWNREMHRRKERWLRRRPRRRRTKRSKILIKS